MSRRKVFNPINFIIGAGGLAFIYYFPNTYMAICDKIGNIAASYLFSIVK